MNKSIKEQLEKLYCQDVKQLDMGCTPPGSIISCDTRMRPITFIPIPDIEESALKPTESSHNQVESVLGTWMLEDEDEGLYDE